MVLSRLTKITGPGVSTDTNWVGNNADFTGITTSGTSFNIGVTTIHSNLIEAHNIKSTGILTATGGSFSGNVTAVDGTFSGNVSIAGTLTYEDLTNIDSVGLITARDGIFLPDSKKAMFGNTAADPDLEIYHGGTASYISHSGTGNLFIHSNTVALRKQNQQAYFVGVNGQSKLYESGSERLVTTDKGITVGTGVTIETNGQANFAGITTVSGTDLVVKPPTVSTSRIKLGYNEQMKIYVSSSNQNIIQSTAAYLQIASNNINLSRADTNLHMARFLAGQQCKLTYNYIDRIATSGVGATVYGQFDTTNLNIAGVSTFTGNIDANGDLDVDGHTNLDNVNIVGVTTTTDNIHIGTRTHTANSSTALKNIHMGSEFWNGTAGDHRALKLIFYGTSGSAGQYGLGVSNSTLEIQSNNSISMFAGGVSGNVKTRRFHINSGGDYLFDSGTLYVQDKIGHYNDANTNIRFPLNDTISFETAGSERLRIGSAGQLGIAGTNYGTSGQALVSQGSGSSVAWQTITGTTINNNADNRIITGSGTANTLNGESGLTFNGTDLVMNTSGGRIFCTRTSGEAAILLGSGNAGGATLYLDGDSNGDWSGGDYAYIRHNTNGHLHIVADNPAAQGAIDFFTGNTTYHGTITSDGILSMNGASNSRAIEINPGGNAGTIVLDRNGYITSMIRASDGGSNVGGGSGGGSRLHLAKNAMNFQTFPYVSNVGDAVTYTTRCSIDTSGHFVPGADNTYDLGTSSLRWRDIYTGDLHLSNETKGANDVDGSWGDWTLQEGESDVFMINNRSGKKFKIKMEEVN